MVVNSILHDLSRYQTRPKLSNHVHSQVKGNIARVVASKQTKRGDETLESKTVDELRQHCPELVAQVEATAKGEGATAERQRLQAIDEISQSLASELVNKAKYEQPITAQELAFESLKADAAKGNQYVSQRAEEINNSGAGEVKTEPEKDGGEAAAFIDKIAASANQKRNKGVK
jgi:hypothetical protein